VKWPRKALVGRDPLGRFPWMMPYEVLAAQGVDQVTVRRERPLLEAQEECPIAADDSTVPVFVGRAKPVRRESAPMQFNLNRPALGSYGAGGGYFPLGSRRGGRK